MNYYLVQMILVLIARTSAGVFEFDCLNIELKKNGEFVLNIRKLQAPPKNIITIYETDKILELGSIQIGGVEFIYNDENYYFKAYPD